MGITQGEKNLICEGKQNKMQMCSCHFQHSLRPVGSGSVFEGILLKGAPIKARVLQASAAAATATTKLYSTTNFVLQPERRSTYNPVSLSRRDNVTGRLKGSRERWRAKKHDSSARESGMGKCHLRRSFTSISLSSLGRRRRDRWERSL